MHGTVFGMKKPIATITLPVIIDHAICIYRTLYNRLAIKMLVYQFQAFGQGQVGYGEDIHSVGLVVRHPLIDTSISLEENRSLENG